MAILILYLKDRKLTTGTKNVLIVPPAIYVTKYQHLGP